jgi:hypothetical protein
MTWADWVCATTLLAVVVGGIAFALGFLFGRAKGFERGWLAYRKRTDPNIRGGGEHPIIRKQNERRWIKEAVDDLRAAQKHDREHWN